MLASGFGRTPATSQGIGKMIYGRKRKQLDESGLLEMQEVTFSVTAEQAQALAEFFREAALEREEKPKSASWHRHVESELSNQINGEVIVMLAND